MPCSRRSKPRHININTSHFQKGEWEALWTQALLHNNLEVVQVAKKLDCKQSEPAAWREMQNCLRTMEPSSGLLVCLCAICVVRLNRRLVLV
jgi:hypothetical protein